MAEIKVEVVRYAESGFAIVDVVCDAVSVFCFASEEIATRWNCVELFFCLLFSQFFF